ncbi:MAG: hypothetical protein HC923_00275 [Myxococcales bacterium]|nr:hypothetical protein [Myxococcales bacterium]
MEAKMRNNVFVGITALCAFAAFAAYAYGQVSFSGAVGLPEEQTAPGLSGASAYLACADGTTGIFSQDYDNDGTVDAVERYLFTPGARVDVYSLSEGTAHCCWTDDASSTVQDPATLANAGQLAALVGTATTTSYGSCFILNGTGASVTEVLDRRTAARMHGFFPGACSVPGTSLQIRHPGAGAVYKACTDNTDCAQNQPGITSTVATCLTPSVLTRQAGTLLNCNCTAAMSLVAREVY